MRITIEKLKEFGAWQWAVYVFNQHFPSGEADYQQVLDKFAELKEYVFAEWLMPRMPSTNAVLEFDELEAEHLYFAGSIVVKSDVKIQKT